MIFIFLGIVKIGGSLTPLRWFTNPDLPEQFNDVYMILIFLGIVKIGGSLTPLRWFTNPDLH